MFVIQIKVRENRRDSETMDNPEKLGKETEEKQNKKHNTENWKDEQHGSDQKPEMNPCAHEG